MSRRTQLIAELATSHGGNVDLACDMVLAAADAGADWVKIQTYRLEAINPADPQRDWLIQAHLDKAAHERIMAACQQAGVQFLSTPFDAESLQMLRDLGLTTFKIASSESGNDWWDVRHIEHWIVSWPWGVKPESWTATSRTVQTAHRSMLTTYVDTTHLTAIPLYPTPLEAVGRATLLDGWSCHTEGISACQWAIAQGAKIVEVHLCLPPRSRVKSFDKTPAQLRQIRQFAEDCATMTSGVGQTFRERWRRV